MSDSSFPIFTVSEVTKHIKNILEEAFPLLVIKGEVSNFRPSSTGHYYFSLKDSQAVINAVMFKNRTSQLDFHLKDGMQIECTGALSVYAGRGTYQVICHSLRKAGEGDLLAELERRKQRLSSEGLFDQEKKKAIPLYPETVGVVSSPTGAALKDILSVLKRRNAGMNVRIFPCAVQGELASEQIRQQVDYANEHKLADVLIVGRGGGSIEDLLPFSDEALVRAIYASKIPVISAVGHEIDNSLLDYAADERAPTPSAAAEMISQHSGETLYKVKQLQNSMVQNLHNRLKNYRVLLKSFSLSELEREFQSLIHPHYLKLDDLKEALSANIQHILTAVKHKVAILETHLQNANPYSILERGYAVVYKKDSYIPLKHSADADIGESLIIHLHKGNIEAEVKECQN